MKKASKGVGVIITNNKRDRFYLQQKDNTHPVPQCRLKFCFFGGAVEDGEDELSTIKREINEEISSDAAEIISKKAKRLFESSFVNIIDVPTTFVFYESVLSDKELLEISDMPVSEGKGLLVGIKDLYLLPFLIDLEHMLRRYLGILSNFVSR
jgi:8-oxo-dGTP pyrophosphatase MutT (NUDIX family)